MSQPPYQSIVEAYPADWLAFAGLGPVGRVDLIDANLSTITAEADKVLRVAGAEPWLAHIEFQTRHEAALPRRLLRYNTLLDDRHDLPTRSLVVLLRPEADGPGLSGVYRRSIPGGPPFLEFHYDVVRAWLQPVEAILDGGLGTLPMARSPRWRKRHCPRSSAGWKNDSTGNRTRPQACSGPRPAS